MDTEYLDRSLSQRVTAARTDCATALDRVMRQNAAAGRLASGASLKMFSDETVGAFKTAYLEAQQFTFNLTVKHEEVDRLSKCASEMIAVLMVEVTERSSRLGIHGTVVPNQLAAIQHSLEELKRHLTDDFQHGMRGTERLKKDPVVSVINNQTNSPGAIQQIGIGDNFSQQAFAQNHQELLNAIDRALASQEFAQLPADQKEAFSDTAGVVKEEASKSQPDVGKLKRWGRRLVDLGKDLGMKVATGEIVHLLAKMFGA
jgi:hypothetical protein